MKQHRPNIYTLHVVDFFLRIHDSFVNDALLSFCSNRYRELSDKVLVHFCTNLIFNATGRKQAFASLRDVTPSTQVERINDATPYRNLCPFRPQSIFEFAQLNSRKISLDKRSRGLLRLISPVSTFAKLFRIQKKWEKVGLSTSDGT